MARWSKLEGFNNLESYWMIKTEAIEETEEKLKIINHSTNEEREERIRASFVSTFQRHFDTKPEFKKQGTGEVYEVSERIVPGQPSHSVISVTVICFTVAFHFFPQFGYPELFIP
ncbi:hypothetical protein L1987_43072 [Smallanthus sonchifolius]|uniref:Uncharacterized protein n=1 Tax=Smallanthus sonchifolius TaxID=185202 RepID=A0ACB9GLB3_9ASTR|nr:hypothetical protein L1987_43072 [Smallanthus sonchifolius]